MSRRALPSNSICADCPHDGHTCVAFGCAKTLENEVPMPSLFARYEDDPDPVVAALAVAHGAALQAGETETAKALQVEIQKLTDHGYEMFSMLRDVATYIDHLRYYEGCKLGGHKISPTSSKGFGENVDQWLATLASKCIGATQDYADRKGWEVRDAA